MNILVLNCGSSSVKFQLINMENEAVVAKGIVEELGRPQSKFKYKANGKEDYVDTTAVADHEAALIKILNILMHPQYGVIVDKREITGIGHRVVHGGSEFASSILIDEQVIDGIRTCIPLSPLHNPANLTGIEVAEKLLSGIPQVAVFDTSHGATLPPEAYTYAIPSKWRDTYKIRRYGFHGTSHSYVAKKAAELLGKPASELRIVTCHLGNGASISAVKFGHCVETSMGLTPLEGLVMGTRSGDIDPAIIPFIGRHEKLTMEEIDAHLNKKSGMMALTGDSDFRIIEERAEKGSAADILALDIYVHRIKKYIGAYAFVMGGLDAIVFTAGIGEKSSYVRSRVLADMEDLGIILDEQANQKNDLHISTGRVKAMVIPTNEELKIARDTKQVLGL
ncbi:MAG: acetate kinase [Calditrichaeota bacterium]|nr:MAG: acetate kinase [Calditrichota bacterium]